MKLPRFNTILYNIKAQLGPGNGLGLSSYSTATSTATRGSKWKGSMDTLFRRISPMGNPNVSIVPLLNQWVEEGHPVDKQQLQRLIKELRFFRRFTHALEISMWMTDKRYLNITAADAAVQLDLIAKVKGIEEAENYFSNVSEKIRALEVYSALLNCYSYVKSAEKAEATMQKMRDLGLARSTLVYNSMLKLYYQTGNFEKLDSLMHEMEENGITYDRYTYCTRLSAYADASDREGIDKILTMMEADPDVALDWVIYTTAANGYAKVGLLDKALAMLKKSEEQIKGGKIGRAYNFLLSLYGKYGKKDDVLRIWELYKKVMKVHSNGYKSVISSLLKCDDLESAENIFEEWESQNLPYDTRIPNFLIDAYCRNGLLEKAENLINHEKLKGREIHVKAWYYLAAVYRQNNQTHKAVEAMKEVLAAYRTPSKWKPSVESLAACLDYFKDEGDTDGAKNFIELLKDKDFIPADLEDKLLDNVQNGKSNLETLRELYGNSLVGNEEALSGPEGY